MVTPQAQLKLNLPLPLKKFAENRARTFGLPIAGYIKHLILKDVEAMNYPVFTASKQAERAFREAQKEQREGKLVETDNVSRLLDNL